VGRWPDRPSLSFAEGLVRTGVIRTGVVALSVAAGALGWFVEEVEEDLFRFLFLRILIANVVAAVVVVIPDRDDGTGGDEFLVTFVPGQLGVFVFHHRHVFGVGVDAEFFG
jgi:hypothetical protein